MGKNPSQGPRSENVFLSSCFLFYLNYLVGNWADPDPPDYMIS